MENTDKNFFIALAYTAATEKDLDILAFRQKVEDNYKDLVDKRQRQPMPKADIHKRSDFGL